MTLNECLKVTTNWNPLEALDECELPDDPGDLTAEEEYELRMQEDAPDQEEDGDYLPF